MSAPPLPRAVRGLIRLDYFLVMPALARLWRRAALWWPGGGWRGHVMRTVLQAG